MKLQPDSISGPTVSGYGEGWIAVNGEKFSNNLVVNSASGASLWRCTNFDSLQTEHFEQFLTLAPELVVFGSGQRIRFLHPKILASLYARRIGVETMDTHAACRTYNFLVGEGRRVVAALLL